MEARTSGAALPSLDLARTAEARDPRIRVTFVPLSLEAGEAIGLGVEGRVDPQSGRQFERRWNGRDWGAEAVSPGDKWSGNKGLQSSPTVTLPIWSAKSMP